MKLKQGLYSGLWGLRFGLYMGVDLKVLWEKYFGGQ